MGPYQLLVLLSLFRLWYLHRPQSTGHQKKVGLGILREMILLVFWVKLADWLKSWWGILIPKPVWPHCPYCKVMGFWSPKMGCPLVTRKSVCRGSKLILSLMGRPLRQSVPDQLEGNKMLMLSKAAFPRVLKYNWLEVALNNSYRKKIKKIPHYSGGRNVYHDHERKTPQFVPICVRTAEDRIWL